MFEPVRGGTRGGQAEFKWADVSADKDRENYLGHSINAPTGRWQKNKDVHWYSRDKDQTEEERLAEIKKIKDAEAEAMAAMLGFAAKPGTSASAGGGAVSGANAVPVVPKAGAAVGEELDPEREERKKRKAERKEEKRLKKERKEKRRAERGVHEDGEDGDRERRRHDRDRSRSPRRDHDEPRSRRARSSPREGSQASPDRDYGAFDRERERERDRRRWDDNLRREQSSGARWGRDR
ncbi:hypothetical protein EUX98_g2785 [Antrodiella citrinella]|uniref:Multiple myeloma tumor-associated protein 2-like N-terminal domain-containing protein n=1 Tax=Antrodiella citrinella TaxID=2447956 RepID=A0A4S4MY48_9APHY|nr:hypothetical protein EUX98_g2785 [Antrodiella citrinella]